MRYGISAGAILINEQNQILLVHHYKRDEYDFWIPPGGSLEGIESIYDCAKREVLEETGLHVELEQILYIQEFWDAEYHFCKFFIKGKIEQGQLTLENKDQDESWLVDVQFFSREELKEMTVFPEILKDQFWLDLEDQNWRTKYLGLEKIKF